MRIWYTGCAFVSGVQTFSLPIWAAPAQDTPSSSGRRAPRPWGLVARNAHDVAGAAAAERTAQGDVERDQLQRGALDDPEGANEAAQSASGVSSRAGAGHRSGACEAQARDDRRRIRALAVVDIEISEGDPAVPRYVAGCWDGAFPAPVAVERPIGRAHV